VVLAPPESVSVSVSVSDQATAMLRYRSPEWEPASRKAVLPSRFGTPKSRRY
jgi:hypothetical protein